MLLRPTQRSLWLWDLRFWESYLQPLLLLASDLTLNPHLTVESGLSARLGLSQGQNPALLIPKLGTAIYTTRPPSKGDVDIDI